MNDSTIAAISTGLTNSGIGIVRISGCDSLKIIDKIFKGKIIKNYQVKKHILHIMAEYMMVINKLMK